MARINKIALARAEFDLREIESPSDDEKALLSALQRALAPEDELEQSHRGLLRAHVATLRSKGEARSLLEKEVLRSLEALLP